MQRTLTSTSASQASHGSGSHPLRLAGMLSGPLSSRIFPGSAALWPFGCCPRRPRAREHRFAMMIFYIETIPENSTDRRGNERRTLCAELVEEL